MSNKKNIRVQLTDEMAKRFDEEVLKGDGASLVAGLIDILFSSSDDQKQPLVYEIRKNPSNFQIVRKPPQGGNNTH